MRIGGEYRLRDIGQRQWAKLAAELHLNENELRERLPTFAKRIPDDVNAIRKQFESEGLTHQIVSKMSDSIAERARDCLRLLELGKS